MKKLFVVTLCSFISFSVFAAGAPKTYRLKMDLKINGKLVSSPALAVLEGEKALITQDNGAQKSYIEVTAKPETSPDGKPSIFMDFTIGEIASDGTKSITATPKMFVAENKKAEVTVGTNNKKESLSLSLVVNEKKL